jgi:outer membrane protein OmpA-like peptidoglycan-associated protein
MSLDRSSVRTVPLKGEGVGAAMLPTPEAVERGEYRLSRPLWLYSRGSADEGVRRVLSCWLSSDGQAEIAKAGFTAVTADRAVQRTLPARERAPGATVTRVTFGAGAARLDREMQRALTEVSNGAAEVWITGHAQPEEERASGNRLSEARARAVEEFLRARAVTVAGAEGLLSLDRQVEVWWLSRR